MCGIVGELAFPGGGEVGARAAISATLIELMRRRGPDGEGSWTDGRGFSVGFRRLAILDLSANADQPMFTSGGRHVIVYNGELYNFRELRRELERKGERFRSTGDTEVVLQALAHWGTAALARFNGMFALAFYDTETRRLLLARDHAGIKPLYYRIAAQGAVFASQYDQILAHPWSRGADVSPDALGLYLRLGYIPAPYALLRESHQLEPGTWLEISADGVARSDRFFELAPYRTPDLHGREAHDAVEEAVTAAVRRHLVADVPAGTFLSGGIDSPLIAALARAVSDEPIVAFTMGTNGDELDESPDAIAYAAEIGLEHIVAHVTPESALAMLDDAVSACTEPFADYSVFPTLAISRSARRRVKVMLAGDGGDELFWGYAGRFSAALNQALQAQQPAPGRSWDVKKLLAVAALGKGDARWPGSIGDVYRLHHVHFSEQWLARMFPDLPPWPADYRVFEYDDWDPDRTAQWLRWCEFTCYLPLILQKVDRGSMYHSLEVRVPLLDRDVIETAARVDWRSCLDPERRIGKFPLRSALAKHVSHQTTSKRGFTVPMAAWLRGALRPVVEEKLLPRREILGLPLHTQTLQQMFAEHLSGADHGWNLWLLLSLVLWDERHYQPHRASGS